MGWLQWCPDPQNQLRGLGAARGPVQDPARPPAPEVAPDPGPGSIVTGKLCFMNHHSVGCVVLCFGSQLCFSWLTPVTAFLFLSRASVCIRVARSNLLQPGFKLILEGNKEHILMKIAMTHLMLQVLSEWLWPNKVTCRKEKRAAAGAAGKVLPRYAQKSLINLCFLLLLLPFNSKSIYLCHFNLS